MNIYINTCLLLRHSDDQTLFLCWYNWNRYWELCATVGTLSKKNKKNQYIYTVPSQLTCFISSTATCNCRSEVYLKKETQQQQPRLVSILIYANFPLFALTLQRLWQLFERVRFRPQTNNISAPLRLSCHRSSRPHSSASHRDAFSSLAQVNRERLQFRGLSAKGCFQLL